MAQVKPEYEALDEFSLMAQSISQKFPERFGNLDLAKIKAVVITNKEKPDDPDKAFEIIPVKMPVRMDCPFAYYIVLWASHWAEQSDEHKLLIVAKALRAIPADEAEEGKVLTPDMKDFADMVLTFGPDYLNKENPPHLLRDSIKWVERGL
jgi:hypothetical protein